FLVSVSKPILTKNLNGLGEYKIKDIELNASFIKSVTLVNVNDSSKKKKYYFYSTEKALKTAYNLGEIDNAHKIQNLQFMDTNFSKWSNTKVEKDIAYDEMVALFYNNDDGTLSEKKVRQALNI